MKKIILVSMLLLSGCANEMYQREYTPEERAQLQEAVMRSRIEPVLLPMPAPVKRSVNTQCYTYNNQMNCTTR